MNSHTFLRCFYPYFEFKKKMKIFSFTKRREDPGILIFIGAIEFQLKFNPQTHLVV